MRAKFKITLQRLKSGRLVWFGFGRGLVWVFLFLMYSYGPPSLKVCIVSFLTLGTEFPLLDFHENFLCSEKPRPEDEESFLNPVLFSFLYLTRHLACIRITQSQPRNTGDTFNSISDGSKAVVRVV